MAQLAVELGGELGHREVERECDLAHGFERRRMPASLQTPEIAPVDRGCQGQLLLNDPGALPKNTHGAGEGLAHGNPSRRFPGHDSLYHHCKKTVVIRTTAQTAT